MPRKPTAGCLVTYESVHHLTDLSMNALYQAATPPKAPRKRHELDINSLESVVLWLAAHARTDIRKRICGLAAQSLLDDGELKGAPHRGRTGRKRGRKARM
jgi:hypothetical protein